MHTLLENFRLKKHHFHRHITYRKTRISLKQVSIISVLSISNADLNGCQTEGRSIWGGAVSQSPTQRVIMYAAMKETKYVTPETDQGEDSATKKKTVG